MKIDSEKMITSVSENPSKKPLAAYSLKEVISRCQEERLRFKTSQDPDSPFCMEIFRRAVIPGQEDEAWEAIYTIFGPLVRAWTNSVMRMSLPEYDAEDFIQETFFTFFNRLKTNTDLLERNQIAVILGYLKMVAKSTVMRRIRDHRTMKRSTDNNLSLGLLQDVGLEPYIVDPKQSFESDVEDTETARAIYDRIKELTTNEQEQAVVDLYLLLNYRPREILRKRPDLFENGITVYRAIQAITRRIMKDDEIQKLLGLN